MAKTDIGPKIGIEGEAQFRRELGQINQGLKTLDAEAKAVAASMQDETDAEKKAAAQKDVLNRQILSQQEKLEKLQSGLEASARKYGEADTRTQKWQKAVFDATKDLANMEHELKGLDGSVDEATDSMEEAGDAAMGWADVMKGQLLADAVKNGVMALAGWIKDGATALWDASKAGAAYADELLTLATTTGVSIDTLQELAYMEGIADVSTQDVAGAINKLKKSMATAESQNQSYAKKMAEAAKETDEQKRAQKEANIELGDTAAAYQELGVAVKDANGNFRRGEDVFFDMIEALGKVEDETRRDQLAMTLMGKSATELNPIITAGADALAEMRKEANDTGYVLSGSALTALGKQQDAMDRLDKRVEAVSNRFAAKLAPGVTQGAEALNEAFDNPRVERGLNVLSEKLGDAVSGAMNLAAEALPKLFQVLNFGDESLRLFNDEQLDLVNRLDEVSAAHDEMVSEFKENAKGIVAETERTEGLWKELQTLVGKNGEVKAADEERVNFINSQLKEALGVQMKLEDGILQGYVDQKDAIGELIQKREAEALIAAGADEFTKALKDRSEALAVAAQLYPQVEQAQKDLKEAEEAYAEAKRYANQMEDNGSWSANRALRYEQEFVRARNDAREALDLLTAKYKDAEDKELSYFEKTYTWQLAQTAAANENYKEVVRILTSEFEVNLEYYREKKALSDQEKADLRDKIKDAELQIAEYRRKMEAGVQGWSEAGLQELEDFVAEARRLLDGKAVGGAFVDGMVAGLEDPQRMKRLRAAAQKVARTVDQNARRELQIQSPSKKGAYIGRMWDEGIGGGLKAGEPELKRLSEQLARTIASGSVPSASMLQTASYSGVMAAPVGSYGSAGGTASYTTNMGGITVRIDGAGAVNADELAQRVAVRLTDQLNRAARGGRR
jgi:hypothetical protein